MKRCVVIGAFLITPVLMLCVAQAQLAGTWKTDMTSENGVDHIAMEFKVVGSKMTGTITRTLPENFPPTTIEGTLKGDVVEFSVKTRVGSRTIEFVGLIHEGEIQFTRKVVGTGGGDGIFGETGPSTFKLTRVRR